MALSESNKIKICQILGIVMPVLDQQITLLSTSLTSTVQTAIEAQITLWDAGAGTDTVKLHPKESNKGVETNPLMVRADIKRNIAVLLEMPEWGGSQRVTVRAMRG